MSIRYIAEELYRLDREVEEIRRQLEEAPAGMKPDLNARLRQARHERKRMREILESKKDPPTYRTSFR